ncbi:MAG: M23 family metallopeptidase, partial [Bacteroidota bacterium]
LLSTKQALARQKARLQEKEREEAEARDAVRRQRNEVAIKTELALTRLKDANAARAQAERELAAFEKASSEIEAMLARVQRAGVSGGAYSGSWGGSFLRPVPGRITSPFGWRIHPLTHTRRFHDGVDLACSGGTPIHAADKGRVVLAGWYGPYGQAVIIDHGSGMSTLYGHTRSGSLRVCNGQVVQRGQIIAGVGSTGWSTGNHLHFSVRRYGRPVSPY